CPTTALKKNEQTGLVDFFQDKCVGCKLCITACPIGAIALVDGLPAKCDLCGGDPACIKLCEPGAITLGEAESIVESQNLILAEKIRTTFLRK
ncbi:MAG: 4Fe-4S binding protein, partial [Dehalococcoidia bacterium]|nr:4Fe-4S binding protein [Dehalococcoidia bacterium]